MYDNDQEEEVPTKAEYRDLAMENK